MAFIKKIMALPVVRLLVSNKILRFILFSLIILAPFVLLIRYLRKKRAGAAGEEEKKLAPRELVNIWKKFRKEIPSEFRWTISQYQHFVVFGDAGSGKSSLIDNYTDWQGLSNQFYPSYTADPTLQFYLGSQKLVQEIPSTLLRDSSPEARRALIKLWKRFYGKKAPVIICVLNATSLTSVSPDSLRTQAQMMRGKLNLISHLMGRPPKIHLVLTHMDQMDGFLEFSNFLDKNNIPLKINLDEHISQESLSECLEPYEEYLPLALTTQNSGDYNKILQFLHQAPDSFTALHLFINSLVEEDPLSLTPEVSDVFFSSNTLQSEVSNPFVSDFTVQMLQEQQRRYSTMRRACLYAAVGGFVYLAGGYFYEQRQVNKHIAWADEQLRIYASSNKPSAELRSKVGRQINELAMVDDLHPLMKVLPRYRNDMEELHQKYLKKLHSLEKSILMRASTQRVTEVEKIRNNFILPKLKKFVGAVRPHEKVLYTLALLYSSRENKLGEAVLTRPDDWATIMELPRSMIQKYVQYNEKPWKGTVSLKRLIPWKIATTTYQKPETWLVFLLEISKSLDKSFLFSYDLKEFQIQSKRLGRVLATEKNYSRAKELYSLLALETEVNLGSKFGALLQRDKSSQWIMANFDRLSMLLQILEASTIKVPLVKDLDLRGLTNNLQAIALLGKSQDKLIRITLARREFNFKLSRWIQLLQRSKVRRLVRKFISYHQRNRTDVFFTDASAFADVSMNSGNYGGLLFEGKAKIPGRYTHQAYDKKVKPAVEELYSLLQKFPINPEDRRLIYNFVSQQVDEYADLYRKYTELYYHAFSIRATSVGALRIILTQMAQPSSPFRDFLTIIRENTNLQENTCPLLLPLYKRLEPFQFINRLLEEKKKTFPEMETYTSFLKQMNKDLEGGGGGDKKDGKKEEKKDDKPAVDPFDDVLSPAGKMSFLMYVQSPRSYLAQIQLWMKSVGIEDRWQKPFLAPIYQLYTLGKEDLEKKLALSWKNVLWPKLLPVLSKFPFHQKANKAITPLELENALHPQSTFWLNFRQLIGPVCDESEKGFTLKKSVQGFLRLPPDMLRIVNHLYRLSKTLWDKEGNAAPLVLRVKSMPLPRYRIKDKVVVLSFISSGGSELYGFNQKPTWRKFSIKWWEEGTAKIGIKMKNMTNDKKSFQDTTIPQGLWSFYRLLQKSDVYRRGVWTWGLLAEYPSDKFKIQFAFERDPWSHFSIKGLKIKKKVLAGDKKGGDKSAKKK